MKTQNIIDGLNDLAKDRKSFFSNCDDEVFRHDYQVCIEAVNLIKSMYNQDGKNLTHTELMAVGYDEDMESYGVICGVASDQEMADSMMSMWHQSWKYVDLIDYDSTYNIGDKYIF